VIAHNELNGRSSIDRKNLGNHHVKEIKVTTLTFSKIMERLNLPNIEKILIKVDVEGHENQVLRSIIEYFDMNTHIKELMLLVEIRDKNIDEIKKNFITKFTTFRKISYDDYLITLKR
jgi:FkbM family methyltransferase